ncbi:class I SAM-dependent methyltransferase [Neptunicoccus cionae]|uniref:class I SAM-dependent methyltransferase n=1 Tax=Neptunicoccus cionae TaxID=2035344 RepID=UPI000C758DF8|nr:class I SAM-dependent methyltransferase [Amylibacter cionae]PLS23228.1 ubiquinone biosynthesis protein UbiE [Amylibacter cionae]
MQDTPNAEQADFWTDGAGRDWITFEVQLDALFGGVNQALLQTAAPVSGQMMLDVGCGTGATSREFAKAVGPNGQVQGLDISTTMLEQARITAKAIGLENVTFVRADAQTEPLPENRFDHIISRFGVMFFDDPVAAFKNIFKSLNHGGNLTMACWGPFKENPWFTLPRRAATDLLGNPPPMNPRDPGPFAFADTDYVLSILKDAGFAVGKATTKDIPLTLQGSAADAAELSSYIGPANSVIRAQGGTAKDNVKIVEATKIKLEQYSREGTVTVPSKIHIYTAHKET